MLTFSRSGIHGLRLDKPQDDVAVALAGAAHFNGPASAPRVRAFNHCVLDLVKRELRSNDGDLIDLTDAEFRLLVLFVENPARVLSRDELARLVLGRGWSPLDRTLDGHVARLRRKLEGPTDEPRLIKSVRTVGYVFAGEVSLR